MVGGRGHGVSVGVTVNVGVGALERGQRRGADEAGQRRAGQLPEVGDGVEERDVMVSLRMRVCSSNCRSNNGVGGRRVVIEVVGAVGGSGFAMMMMTRNYE